jgi:hypothetical protein
VPRPFDARCRPHNHLQRSLPLQDAAKDLPCRFQVASAAAESSERIRRVVEGEGEADAGGDAAILEQFDGENDPGPNGCGARREHGAHPGCGMDRAGEPEW